MSTLNISADLHLRPSEPRSHVNGQLIGTVIAPLLVFLIGMAMSMRKHDVLKWFVDVETERGSPPLLSARLPIFGHQADMLLQGHMFWPNIHKRANQSHSMITLPSTQGRPGSRQHMYVVNRHSRPLHKSIMANKSLRLVAMLPNLMSGWAPMSSRAKHDLPRMLDKILITVPRTLSLSRKAGGREMQRIVLQGVKTDIDALYYTPQSSYNVDLARWIRDTASRALLAGFAGHRFPWCHDQEFIDAYWDYEHDLLHFSASPMPWLTAPRGNRAREYLMSRLEEWVGGLRGGDVKKQSQRENLSPFANILLTSTAESGWSARDSAGMALVMIRATLSNEVPSLYWFFMQLFSRRELLGRVRDEAQRFVAFQVHDGAKDGMNSEVIEKGCPLLYACYKECQRRVLCGPIIREVLKDTVVHDDQGREYFLNKGSALSVPLNVLHADEDIWGDDAAEFKPERFLLASCPPDMLLTFGGGRDVCPGRFLASSTICWTMLLFVLGVEVETEGAALLEVPEPGFMPLPTLIWSIPRGMSQKVKLKAREGWERTIMDLEL